MAAGFITFARHNRRRRFQQYVALASTTNQPYVLGVPEPLPESSSIPDVTELNDNLDDIVQFDAAIYYAIQTEPRMRIDVTRLGAMKGVCSVDFRTEDGTALAGVRYASVEGTLTFKDGETVKTIVIPILDDNRWNPTLEFMIRLTNPRGCELGRFLYVSRVKVLDTDAFPTNKYGEEIKQFGAGSVSGIDLLIEYSKLNLTYEGIAWKSTVTLVIDLLQSFYLLLTTYAIQFVADDVLGSNPATQMLLDGSKQKTLVATAALYIIPAGILNILDVWKSQLGIAEVSRSKLQDNIMTKFMNYTEESRQKVSSSEISLVMVSAVNEVVDSGYMNVFQLSKNASKLAVSSYFILAESPDAILPLIFFGLGSTWFISSNYQENAAAREKVAGVEASIVDIVQEGSQKYRLFADYFIRPQLQKKLNRRVQKLSDVTKPVATSEVTREYFPIWLSTILVSGWLFVGGQQVLAGNVQVGNFLATVNVFKNVGEAFKDIFFVTLDVSKAIGPLQQVTQVLNYPISLRDMMRINRQRRRVTKEQRNPENLKRLRQLSGQRYGTDGIPIVIRNLSFKYPGAEEQVLSNVNLYVAQGKFVAMLGGRRVGKRTLVRLLGQVFLPDTGSIFIPSYLRVLHVQGDPLMLKGSLWKNLCVGRLYWTDVDAELERALDICRRIGFTKATLAVLESTKKRFHAGDVTLEEESGWEKKMTKTDLILIHIARAFIYNPEVLVMNQPTRALSPKASETVLSMVREFCDNRGVGLPADSAVKRRPRTACISAARSASITTYADVIWRVGDGTVKEITMEEAATI